ncbi:MAG TPA: hypothetical protein VFO14_06310 [Vicinamibacterales bacterium]|nr:hypothetical protein [Vicinamibacterales bacterium]
MTVRRALAPVLLAAWGCVACGSGSGNGNGTPPPTPAPGPTNPCLSSSLESGPDLAVSAPDPALTLRKRGKIDYNPRWRVLDALWTHRQRAGRTLGEAVSTGGSSNVDVGEVAVLQDEGDLIAPANTFDLEGVGLRFTRNGAGGYDVARIDAAFRSTLGNQVTLTDDDSEPLNVPFSFPFYGQSQSIAFVNSDGNVTFEEEDRASSERNVARLLTGPPRVAPFLADLDPSAGGRVFAHVAADQYTVTWCGVRGFDSPRTATVQLTLLPDGAIEMKYTDSITLPDAVVGVSPGRTGEFSAVNLGDTTVAGGAGAVGERFAQSPQLDTVAVTRKFYATHRDDFDQLIIWTDARLIQDAFAYEVTVANQIRGIGLDLFDVSRDFGSAGQLESYTVMDFISKYPDNPRQKFLGENNTVSVLGQEVGHRWLAFFDFRNHEGRGSDALLGRDRAHWSFFVDSDASVMEGNDIEDLGGGSFQTVAAVERYSLLDQYAMGLVPASEVPPFFYVENPVNSSPSRDRDDPPQVGVRFNGTRRDVLIQDIIAEQGNRVPSSGSSPRVHRQAFVFVVGAGRTMDSAHVDKVDRIRREWETFFREATDRRMRAETALR